MMHFGAYGTCGTYGALWYVMVYHQDTRQKPAKASLAHCWACLGWAKGWREGMNTLIKTLS